MNRLQSSLEELKRKVRKRKHPALMTHVVLGYPSLRESIDIVQAMADSGAALIELQIPFSDPMADGPTIMAANEAALENGVKVKDCFRAAEILSKKVDVPLLFMSYFNILFRYQDSSASGGVLRFCKDAASAGISGLIVADIPPEETSEGYWEHAKESGLQPIPIVSPLSSSKRLKMIGKIADKSFVYCVSSTGTTGQRSSLPSDLSSYLQRVRKSIQAPLAVGFGISNASQIRKLSGLADIAVVGSAMIDTISKTPKNKRLRQVSRFTKELAGR